MPGAVQQIIARVRGAWGVLPYGGQDALLAAAAALALTSYYLISPAPVPAGEVAVAAAGSVLACAPLALRRRVPLTAAALSAGTVTLGSILLDEQSGIWAALAAIGSAAYHSERSRLLLAALAASWMAATLALSFLSVTPYDLVTGVVIGAAPVAFGYALRVKEEQAEQESRLRRAELERARADERAQITREVHDIVGHHLSAIRLQAVGGRRALRTAPDRAEKAFGTIADTSRLALDEIRGLLDLLRGEPGGPGAVPPRMSDLGGLAARLSAGRPRITVVVPPGAERLVPAEVQACVYRVAQESLTNVVRHAGAGEAVVRVEVGGGEVVLTVEDDGAGSEVPAGGGGGLRGMRDRVRLLGGELRAGPRDPRGWRVRAALPLGAGPGAVEGAR